MLRLIYLNQEKRNNPFPAQKGPSTMFSSSQTETTSTTDSTEQAVRLSKNQSRNRARTQSPNWLENSHREYESTIYRAANQGKKRLDPGVAERMATKKAERDAKKQVNQTVQITAMAKPKVSTETKFDETIVQDYITIFGGTQVMTKKFGPRTVVVTFPKLGEFRPRHREVWQLEDGKQPRKLTASYGNKQPITTLEAEDWKWGVLQDCSETLIRHLAGLPPLETNT